LNRRAFATARASTACCSGSLNVVGVEVGVFSPIFGRISVESGDKSGQDAQLLACIIADYANLDTDLGEAQMQLKSGHGHVFYLLRVEAQEAEVVHGIAVVGKDVDLKNMLACHRKGDCQLTSSWLSNIQ
jgi:hypothetical protein